MSVVQGRVGVALALLAFAVALPAVAPAREESARPSPSIRVQPAAPRAGTMVVLTATSPGSGLTHAWDLDGDGAFDDGAGARVTTTLAAGTRSVAVRSTDSGGAVGSERRTLDVHAANSRPSGRLRLVSPVPGAATTTEVVVDASDPDGHVATIEFDIHDDGEYDVTAAFAPGEDAHAEYALSRPGARAPFDARADHRRRGRDHGAADRSLRPPRQPAAAGRDRRHARGPGARRAGDRVRARERPRRPAARPGVRPRRRRHVRDRPGGGSSVQTTFAAPVFTRSASAPATGTSPSAARPSSWGRRRSCSRCPTLPSGRAWRRPTGRASRSRGNSAGPARSFRTRSPSRARTSCARVRATAGWRCGPSRWPRTRGSRPR